MRHLFPIQLLLRSFACMVWLLLCLAGGKAAAKAVIYDGRDGLNSNDITAIAKDKRGLMWLGTYSGLNIYDGYTFTKAEGPLGSTGITSLSLHEKKNELLVATAAGLYSINLSTLQSTQLQAAHKAAWSRLQAHAICTLPASGAVYVSFGGGYIAQLMPNNRLELVCRLPDTLRTISHLVPFGQGMIASNGDTWYINLAGKTAAPLNTWKHIMPFSSLTRSGHYLLLNSYSSGLSLFDLNTMTHALPAFLRAPESNIAAGVLRSAIKGSKLYLVCDNYTFYIADLEQRSLANLSGKYPDIFEGKACNALFIDEHDIIWIATNKGLIKIEERPELFTRELYNAPSRVSTRKMLEDEDGDIYVASYVGLWHYRAATGKWQCYSGNPGQRSLPSPFPRPVQPMSLLPDPLNDALYLGLDNDLLLRFDKRKKLFESAGYSKDLKGESLAGIYTMVRDKTGRIWLGCGKGLAHYDPASGQLVLHRKDAFDTGPVRIKYLYTDGKSDLLYIAAVTGLFIADIHKGILLRLDTRSRPALSNNDVLFAEPDPGGHIWIGTNGGGINILSPDHKKIRYIHKQHGLSNEVVYSIIHEDEHTAWISTFNGLDRYRKDQQSFNNFFEEDGLSSNEFNQNSFLKTKEGKMYFGSINGVTTFYPDRLSTVMPFSVFLAGISRWDDKTQNVKLLQQETDPKNPIIKKPSDLLLELHFGCTDYSDPQRNTFSYRVRELSDNWISLEDRHTLNLSGIPYGEYTIEVRAINSRGVSSANILLFQVKVLQPFYRTWWFFGLVLLGLALVFYIAYQIKYQSFKNILQLRMKIASNLHDEVGSLLTRITMFSDNLRYSKNTEEQRNAKLEKIAALSRNATASMSDVLWTIDSRNDFAGNLLDRMREHTEEMLLPLGIDVNFVVQGTDLKQRVLSDTRGELYLIFKEAINNIVKHSDATRVTITYRMQDKGFLLGIVNDGAREEISSLSTGQGLHNMKMRAGKIGARITVQKNEGLFSVEISN